MSTENKRDLMETAVKEADKVLVGIGTEWASSDEARIAEIEKAAGNLKKLMEGKDYFVITSLKDQDLSRLPFEKERMVAPLDESYVHEDWDRYLKWLSYTMHEKTAILELGEGFEHPEIIRWAFEKAATINLKACLFRVNEKFYQLPEEAMERSTPMEADSVLLFQ